MRLPVVQCTSTSCCRGPVLGASHRQGYSRQISCRAESVEFTEQPIPLESVEAVQSVRLVFDTSGKPFVEYLACWKVGSSKCFLLHPDNKKCTCQRFPKTGPRQFLVFDETYIRVGIRIASVFVSRGLAKRWIRAVGQRITKLLIIFDVKSYRMYFTENE